MVDVQGNTCKKCGANLAAGCEESYCGPKCEPRAVRLSVTDGVKADYRDADGKIHHVEMTHDDGERTTIQFPDGTHCDLISAEVEPLYLERGSLLGDFAEAIDALSPIPAHLVDVRRCDPKCKGWFVCERSSDMYLDIERCQDCNVFKYDDDAIQFARSAGLLTTEEGPFYVVGVACPACGMELDAFALDSECYGSLYCTQCGEVVPMPKPAADCGDCGDTGILFNGAYCVCPAGMAHYTVPNIKDAKALAMTWLEGKRETVIKGVCCLSAPFAAWMALQVGIVLGENNGRQDFLRMLAEKAEQLAADAHEQHENDKANDRIDGEG